jgi:hypothetical protein
MSVSDRDRAGAFYLFSTTTFSTFSSATHSDRAGLLKRSQLRFRYESYQQLLAATILFPFESESSGMADEQKGDLREQLVSACRTAVGDELRSVTYFTEDDEEQIYLRDDLEAGANLVGFADDERLGFRTQADYENSELGEYLFTMRVFERGYLTRVIVGDHGAFVTTDEMEMERFKDLAEAVRAVLGEEEPE